mmetsp:Transcript_67078/g.143528  ORF Transcript_67078/g.143528 Transcript_67078/m.143528 type:complete len:271 (-) Transcript_67078:735-1547(-)
MACHLGGMCHKLNNEPAWHAGTGVTIPGRALDLAQPRPAPLLHRRGECRDALVLLQRPAGGGRGGPLRLGPRGRGARPRGWKRRLGRRRGRPAASPTQGQGGVCSEQCASLRRGWSASGLAARRLAGGGGEGRAPRPRGGGEGPAPAREGPTLGGSSEAPPRGGGGEVRGGPAGDHPARGKTPGPAAMGTRASGACPAHASGACPPQASGPSPPGFASDAPAAKCGWDRQRASAEGAHLGRCRLRRFARPCAGAGLLLLPGHGGLGGYRR